MSFQNLDKTKPTECLLVLGAHYGGTGTVCQVLNLMGAVLPKLGFSANFRDSAKLAEPLTLSVANDAILSRLKTRWDDWRRNDPETWPSGLFNELSKDVCALLGTEFDEYSQFILKEHRISKLLPLYMNALASSNAFVTPVIVCRNPIACAAPLAARHGKSMDECLLLWLRHAFENESVTRGLDRRFIDFDNLKAFPAVTLFQLCRQFERPAPTAEHIQQLESFLQQEQMASPHHTIDAEPRSPIGELAKSVHEAHRALVKQPASTKVHGELDQLKASFETMASSARFGQVA